MELMRTLGSRQKSPDRGMGKQRRGGPGRLRAAEGKTGGRGPDVVRATSVSFRGPWLTSFSFLTFYVLSLPMPPTPPSVRVTAAVPFGSLPCGSMERAVFRGLLRLSKRNPSLPLLLHSLPVPVFPNYKLSSFQTTLPPPTLFPSCLP